MAAARAAARRQAILNSRGDRLSKLTSSARGDDSENIYVHDDPPVPTLGTGLREFVGEETSIPIPTKSGSPASPSASIRSPSAAQATPQPETTLPWGNIEQQQELMRALMGGGASPLQGSTDPNAPPPQDPLSALFASFAGNGAPPAPSTAPAQPKSERKKTFLEKVLPLLHMLSVMMAVAYFLWVEEPALYATRIASTDESTLSKRWSELAWMRPDLNGWGVQHTPHFFWVFATTQLVLHSMRIFMRPLAYRPPAIVETVLPHLPPPFPVVVLSGLRYWNMFGLILNDISVAVFAMGMMIIISNWTM